MSGRSKVHLFARSDDIAGISLINYKRCIVFLFWTSLIKPLGVTRLIVHIRSLTMVCFNDRHPLHSLSRRWSESNTGVWKCQLQVSTRNLSGTLFSSVRVIASSCFVKWRKGCLDARQPLRLDIATRYRINTAVCCPQSFPAI